LIFDGHIMCFRQRCYGLYCAAAAGILTVLAGEPY
jgi:hypothetical protein